jgi:outer membrane biosynthesis protein TonB
MALSIQTMGAMAIERRWAASGGALLVFAGGLALYQLTSLVLGPAEEVRELPLAITAPSVDLPDLSQPVIDNVTLVPGTGAQPLAPAPTVAAPTPKAAVKASIPSRSSVTPKTPVSAPVATLPPRPVSTPKPEPAHGPQPSVKPLPSGD